MQSLAAALFSAQQQTNLALATINFDFSLVKLDAPKEFGPLGQHLTHFRREAAETGTQHITARKLGALFQHALPPTPHLIKAYGTRCSEIASAKADQPETLKSYGIFAEHAGIDGTSIWAAATSGPEAIAVHLLACMLARIWSSPEATSIWSELVAERKVELAAVQETEPNFVACCTASQITLSRDQLRGWDASARAWLQTADDSMKIQQKQLMLILDGVNLPVNSKATLLGGVLQAWKSAMAAVDLLIQGVPQSIQDGSILLGLSSWHIYPDMLVLGTTPTPVEQKDPLVGEGGVLTIGLQIDNGQGSVFWSLPLNHLRYYGGTILAERCLKPLGGHIAPLQLYQVVAGCLSKDWGFQASELASILTQLWDYIAPNAWNFVEPGTTHWLGTLSESLDALVSGSEWDQRSCKQLIQFGQRRCLKFLCPRDSKTEILPLFGLMEPRTFFSYLLADTDKRVELMREYVSTMCIPEGCMLIIRNKHYDGQNAQYEYATAVPLPRQSYKRPYDGAASLSTGHIRWVTTIFYRGQEYVLDSVRSLHFEELGEDTFAVEEESIHDLEGSNAFRWLEPPNSIAVEEESISLESYNAFCWPEPPSSIAVPGFTSFSDVDTKRWNDETLTFKRKMDFKFLAGDPATCALFASATPKAHSELVRSFQSCKQIPASVFQKAIRSGHVNRNAILDHFHDFLQDESCSSFRKCMRALATMSNIYKMLPDATVSLEVTSQPLCDVPWVEEPPIAEDGTITLKSARVPFSALTMDWAKTFSCIAFFESGSFAIPPSHFSNVMAMSVKDSIYIAAPLLCDPSAKPSPFEIRRIRGNVGKPGIAMLIPPNDPKIRKVDYSDWQLIDHAIFDGQPSNSFHQTSLHLSFTGCTFPIDTQSYGSRDSEIYFLESVVSVHDKGQWIADLDILHNLQGPKVLRLDSSCPHSHEKSGNRASIIHNSDLTMVDTWSEILDRPNNAAIIRSSGNWIGRLATTVLSLQMGCDTIVTPDFFCWECVKTVWHNLKHQDDEEQAPHSKDKEQAPHSEDAFMPRWPGSKCKVESEMPADTMNAREDPSPEPEVYGGALEHLMESKQQADAVKSERRMLKKMSNTFIIC